MTATGAQHWFYTQADRNGQMIIHLDVPSSTTVDYDLYVYSYEESTGNLYSFKTSTNGSAVAEHVSFTVTSGSYYFICINSYQGGGSNMYYYLHVETAALETGEINDFPVSANTITPILNNISTTYTGSISMRTDEDFVKFVAVGTGAVIHFTPTNTNIVAELFVLSGSSLNYIGSLTEEGRYLISTTTGNTYYIRVHHSNNKIFGLTSNYTIRLNSFNCADSLNNAAIVGFNVSNSEVVYVANNKLYVNSSYVVSCSGGLESLCHYHFEEPDTTARWAIHDSSTSSPVRSVLPISYTVYGSGMGVSSMSNALALVIRSNEGDLGVHYENWMTSNRNPNTGEVLPNPTRFYQTGYAQGIFILDVSDGQIKDFASGGTSGGNGFYNGFFGSGYSFNITLR